MKNRSRPLSLIVGLAAAAWLAPGALLATEAISRPNEWALVAEGGTGPRVSPALVWSPERKRFVLVAGTISHAHKPPFPYDVLSFDLENGRWDNELPSFGEKWGGPTGPVEPPGFRSPYFEIVDVEGNVRPWQRHAKMWYLGQRAPWDGHLYTLMCGRTLKYDIAARAWTNLEPETAPSPETRSEKVHLNWSAMCPDPVNEELVLFGGCGVETLRADPGTWTYSPKKNEWKQLDLKVQPPPRALSPMAYDPATKKIVLFGGERLDMLYADTWVYDCATRTWEERQPAVSPSPRFAHALPHLPKSGKIVLLGGVGYTSSTAYQARLYQPLPFEIWTYDVAANEWSLVKRFEEGGPAHHSVHAAAAAVDDADRVLWWGPPSSGAPRDSDSSTWLCAIDPTATDSAGTAKHGVKPGTITRRTGSYDPEWYTTDVSPADPAKQKTFYESLSPNRWTPLEAPKWPMNRQGGGWSTVAYDTDRQQILHLGGGHSSYFGNDVAHFDTTTACWSVSYTPQFALDFNYDLSGPGPWAFNGGPWGNHNYHAYGYDPARKRLIFIRGEHTHIYDPERREWSHDERLSDNPFGGSKYTSYVATTPAGVVMWGLRKGSQSQSGLWKLGPDGWTELETSGEPLPQPVTDGSTITFDSKRNRILVTTSKGERGIAHSGQVWSCDLSSGAINKLDPAGREKIEVGRFARESVYLPKRDLVLIGYHFGEKNRLPFYDVASNRWMTADVPGSEFFGGQRNSGASVDLGLQYDSARDLVWGVMCKLHPGSVQALRVDERLALEPLQ
ncbi:MAG: kelch repeat-containing protein [Planctomycetaceae bacterium]